MRDGVWKRIHDEYVLAVQELESMGATPVGFDLLPSRGPWTLANCRGLLVRGRTAEGRLVLVEREFRFRFARKGDR